MSYLFSRLIFLVALYPNFIRKINRNWTIIHLPSFMGCKVQLLFATTTLNYTQK